MSRYYNMNKIYTLEELISNGFSREYKLLNMKAGDNNQLVSSSLLIEHTSKHPARREYAPFTNTNCLPSHYVIIDNVPRYDVRQLYLTLGDHTEYEFANKFFLDYDHWLKVSVSSVWRELVDSWRKELKIKVKSNMYSVLINDALDNTSKTSTSSAKFLISQYFDPKTNYVKKKQETKKNKDDLVVLEDHKRILEGFIN